MTYTDAERTDQDLTPLQTLTYEHTDHGRYEVPADYVQTIARDVIAHGHDVAVLRQLAEDMTDGDTDLSDVTSWVALVVILASLRCERDMGQNPA